MENMKAVRVHNYGGPEVLRFEDSPRPTPGSGKLLIRVHAASVNPIEWKIRAGYMKDHIPLPLPFIPGWDVSGVVEAVGSGTTKFEKGDEVYARPDVAAHGFGAYAEYVVVKEIETALKPKSIDHVHAATVPVGAVSAWRALFDAAGLSSRTAANSSSETAVLSRNRGQLNLCTSAPLSSRTDTTPRFCSVEIWSTSADSPLALGTLIILSSWAPDSWQTIGGATQITANPRNIRIRTLS